MSEQKREMSADEYVTMAKIDSLAKQKRWSGSQNCRFRGTT